MAHSMTCDPPICPDYPNLRAVAGLVMADGRVLRAGHFYRSEALCTPSKIASAAIAALGIRHVFDLRGQGEREAAPNGWWRAQGVRIDEWDLIADARNAGAHWQALVEDPQGEGGRRMMMATYRALPFAMLPHLGRLFDALGEGDGAVLVHCAAGKDRTGIAVALVLAAIGVSRAAILADYLESGDRENPAVVAWTRALLERRLGAPIDAQCLADVTGVDAAYLETAFAAIDTEFGSLDDYFARAGWGSDARAALAERLAG